MLHRERGRVWRGLHQLKARSLVDRLETVVHVEFAVDGLDMGPDRAHGDNQFLGNLRAGQVGREQAQYLPFSPCQRLQKPLWQVLQLIRISSKSIQKTSILISILIWMTLPLLHLVTQTLLHQLPPFWPLPQRKCQFWILTLT